LNHLKPSSPVQEPQPLAYLRRSFHNSYDIHLSVEIQTEGSEQADVISQTNFKYMYWSMAQQFTHHTIAGCNLQVGDLMGSGTISGSAPESYGSLLEITWNNTKPLTLLMAGKSCSFIQDGDTLTMKGYCEKDGLRIGF
jgi:fumarylacetoacetase